MEKLDHRGQRTRYRFYFCLGGGRGGAKVINQGKKIKRGWTGLKGGLTGGSKR